MIEVLVGILMLPFVVYLSVKLGTYAFYRGRQTFLDDEEKKKNG